MQIYIAVGMAYSNVCFVGFEKEEQAAQHMLSNETVKKTMKNLSVYECSIDCTEEEFDNRWALYIAYQEDRASYLSLIS